MDPHSIIKIIKKIRCSKTTKRSLEFTTHILRELNQGFSFQCKVLIQDKINSALFFHAKSTIMPCATPSANTGSTP
jgi:hypothetical protein